MLKAIETNSDGRKDTNSQADNILEVALELFSLHGFDSVSTIQIAKQSGMSQPSVHYHFRNKKELWKAAMRLLNTKMKNEFVIADNLANHDDPLYSLRFRCMRLVELSYKFPQLGRVLLLEGQAGGERLDWLLHKLFRGQYRAWISLIEKAIESGQIKNHDPQQVMMLLHGAAVTYFNLAPVSQSLFGDDPHDTKRITKFSSLYFDVIFSGLQADHNSQKA